MYSSDEACVDKQHFQAITSALEDAREKEKGKEQR